MVKSFLSLSHYLNNVELFIMPFWYSVFQDDILDLNKASRYVELTVVVLVAATQLQEFPDCPVVERVEGNRCNAAL